MKRFLMYCIAAVLLLGLLPACALAVTAESPIILGGTEDDACYGTLSLPNGNLIVSMSSGGGRDGTSAYPGNVHKAWLVCLAPDGSTVWEVSFGAAANGSYTSVQFPALNDDGTFSGVLRYSISQFPQYRQEITLSLSDGSILAEGEQVFSTMETEKINKNYYKNGGYTIMEEIHDCDATCQPRTLHLIGPDGNELWTLDAVAGGMRHIADFVQTEQGTILYGRDESSGDVIEDSGTVMLVDASGTILWRYQPEGLEYSTLSSGILDSQGRFVAAGFARSAMLTDEDGHAIGYNDPSQLLVCLDAATGEALWQQTTAMTDEKLPTDNLMEYDGQYILCTSGGNYNTNVFETLDYNGNELQYWTTSVPEYGLIAPQFFLWDGELWASSILNGSTMDVLLERVVIP